MTDSWVIVALSIAVAILLPFAAMGLWSRRLRRQNRQYASTLDNMNQGLCMFDRDTRIVVCNRRLLEMYQLSPAVVKPGCTFRQLMEHRKATGLFTGDPEAFCNEIVKKVRSGKPTSLRIETRDGRAIHTVNQPTPDGGWIGRMRMSPSTSVLRRNATRWPLAKSVALRLIRPSARSASALKTCCAWWGRALRP
jgi:PAS domain-containing protein